MASPLAMRRGLVGAGLETTSGTAVTVAAALANSAVYDAKARPLGFFDDGERRPIGISAGSFPRTAGKRLGEVTFKTEYRHGDDTYLLLQGAGYVLSGSDLIALPTSDFSARKTLTVAMWEDGLKKQVHGAVCTSVRLLPIGTGQRVMWEWTFQGIWSSVVDEAIPSMPDVDAATPVLRARGMTITVGGASIPEVSTFEVNLNPQGEEREDLTADTGVAHMLVGDRNPQITLDPEARKVAEYDAYGKYQAGVVEVIQLVLTDGTNTLTVDAPAAQRIELEDTERGKKKVDRLRFELHNTEAGDNDLKFTKSA